MKDLEEIASKAHINTKNLKISERGKQMINDIAEQVKPKFEEFTGKKLSNQEAINLANTSSETFSKAIDQKATLQWEASLLNLRRKLAAGAEAGSARLPRWRTGP